MGKKETENVISLEMNDRLDIQSNTECEQNTEGDDTDHRDLKFRHQDHQGRFKHSELFMTNFDKTNAPKPVDLVVTYRIPGAKPKTLSGVLGQLTNRVYRERFEMELSRRGIEIEHSVTSVGVMKLHATDYFLLFNADSSDLNVPIKQLSYKAKKSAVHSLCDKVFKKQGARNPYVRSNDVKNVFGDPHSYFVSTAYSEKQKDIFISDKPSRMFTTIQRTSLLWESICNVKLKFVPEGLVEAHLTNKLYDPSDADNAHADVSFLWLLKKQVYSGVFPLHDYDTHMSIKLRKTLPEKQWPLRPWLYELWVKNSIFKVQPLNAIRAYFGEMTASYFAWLGFYTGWLYTAAVVGLISIFYGYATTYSRKSKFSDMLCSPDALGISEYNCRLCNSLQCHYTTLQQQCSKRILQVAIESEFTIVYSLFISIWAIVLLEFWKRRQHQLLVRWECNDAHSNVDAMRADYMSSKHIKFKTNSSTGNEESYIPSGILLTRLLVSWSITAVFGAIQIIIIWAIILYQQHIKVVFELMAANGNVVIETITPDLLVSVTSALLNAVSIYITQAIWSRVLKNLVDYELQPTTGSYERSYIYKMFLFQFVNYYGLLFYLAIVKPIANHKPAEQSKTRDINCGSMGCLFNVTAQMAMLMTVKELFTHFMDLGLPWFNIKVQTLVMYTKTWMRKKRTGAANKNMATLSRCQKDSLLLSVPLELRHFDDYLSTVIQFGFITIFTVAFPLAPFLALVNNWVKIRIDARKYLTLYKRPIPIARVDMGPWLKILYLLADVAVIVNAVMITCTTNVVDRIVHAYRYEPKNVSFLAIILNQFNTSEYPKELDHLRYHEMVRGDVNSTILIESCLYEARFITDKTDLVNVRINRFYILAIRLCFVIIFVAVVMVVKVVIAGYIPDVSKSVLDRLEKSQRFVSDLQLKNMEKNAARAAAAAASTTPAGSSGYRRKSSMKPGYVLPANHASGLKKPARYKKHNSKLNKHL